MVVRSASVSSTMTQSAPDHRSRLWWCRRFPNFGRVAVPLPRYEPQTVARGEGGTEPTTARRGRISGRAVSPSITWTTVSPLQQWQHGAYMEIRYESVEA